MIHLIVKDGLGNQMFQYAYARLVQSKYLENGYNENLVINPFFLNNTNFKENDSRKLSLQHLNLNENVRILSLAEQKSSMRQFKLQILRATGLFELIKWKIFKIKNENEKFYLKRSKKGIYYSYAAYSVFPTILSQKSNKFIFGFFQSEKNFKEISEIIKTELKVKTTPTNENLKLISEIESTNSICLHIRRGDYLNKRWKNLQVCNFEYYNDSINKILDNVCNPVFYVFSNSHDDIEWIKNNYQFYDKTGKHRTINIIYVDLNNPDYEELRLMYSCKHFIISNSTFSWWGAYLASNPNKIVCVPHRWNLSTKEDINIYLEEWNLI